jgi:Tfp pilus assembly protein PilN
MRAINLIPPEDRRGTRAPARAGLLSYFVIGGLLLVLAGITSLVLTSSAISDKEAEVASLEQSRDEAQARADSLQAFADFGAMQEERTATVTTLAQSRFDWERVMRELALVLPDDVWLTSLTGTVSPAVQLDSAAGLSIRQEVAGPALELIGCTVSQEAVGRFVATLRDIDGVTRVTVARSSLPDQEQAEAPAAEASGDSAGAQVQDDCRTQDFIAQFEIVAAFDEVPVPASEPVDPGAPVDPAAPAAPAEPADGSVPEAQQNTEQAAEIAP